MRRRPGLQTDSAAGVLRQGWAERGSSPRLHRSQPPISVFAQARRRTLDRPIAEAFSACLRLPFARDEAHPPRVAAHPDSSALCHFGRHEAIVALRTLVRALLEFPVPVTWNLPGSDHDMAILSPRGRRP